VLKSRPLAHGAARERVRGALGAEGIGEERVELLGHVAGRAGHLACYHRIDVALDTFPYHGTTTTCEALWMGVPVLVREGRTHAARVGVSLLNRLGLGEWVAGSWEEYEALAARQAGNLDGLEQVRTSLRERLRRSPLTDGRAFTRDLEGAYRQMWRRWCAGSGSPQ
jgi:predicted O-linked N-acetylglucosamine transferase (SPINDLY family)